jgi:hypothetical protein
MVVAGIVAIIIPPPAGIAATLIIGWILVIGTLVGTGILSTVFSRLALASDAHRLPKGAEAGT